MKKNYQLYLFFMLPPLLLLIIFKYIPIGGILMAFEDYSPIQGLLGSEWVGFKHFSRFISSPDFMNLLMNTLKLSVFGLLWGFPIPIILAILISRVKSERLRKNIQLIIYAPNFISVIVISGMIIIFLSPVGQINQLFGTTINFMAKPEAFRTIYIASGIWQGAGWASIIYTAALSNASKELTEAAIIDGANVFQQIWNVDIPAIKPIMVIQFILSAGNIMSIGFEKALALQNNLNLPASEILPTYVYKMGLQMGDYSFSTAVGLFNAVINVILLIIVNTTANKLSKDDEEVQGL
ncbi:ABC transporter permease subunit [Clostridium sp.]|uniref:ABC transporter permease n=1 Tax=Clostridium sp. TaxID=1506 RepID=UPI0025B86DB4|nr:ABC transporter permease subunit [Clostridium sp.]